jgi:predicted PhzF superfamily epimerase YddE/YHI9
MKRRFYQLDVFTQTPLAGNPLAVFTDGDGLSPRLMQAIAREMNLPETVFVQKPMGDRALARLRIFTTQRELPLAGHPVIGTWFLLAQLGVVPAQEGSVRIWQQTGAGILPVDIGFRCHLGGSVLDRMDRRTDADEPRCAAGFRRGKADGRIPHRKAIIQGSNLGRPGLLVGSITISGVVFCRCAFLP